MKNNCSLFERLFKKKKMRMTFSFLEYLWNISPVHAAANCHCHTEGIQWKILT